MVTNPQYTTIERILDDLTEHPLLSDITLEQVIRYMLRFTSLYGFPTMYADKVAVVDIDDFRGTLPCDLISIVQVQDCDSGIFLRSMTDTMVNGACGSASRSQKIDMSRINNVNPMPYGMDREDCHFHPVMQEATFKTQGSIIYTSFPHGKIKIAYKSIPVDSNGYPMILDNETYIAALEAYIKKLIFTIKFDTGKINIGVLQNAQQDYAFLAGELRSEFNTPSLSEMESISRMINTLIPNMRSFDRGFKDLGDREYLRNHR